MSLLGDILSAPFKASTYKTAANWVADHPFQTALIAAGGYYLYATGAAALASSTLAAEGSLPGVAAAGGGEALAGLGGAPLAEAIAAPGIGESLATGAGILGKSAGKAVSTPGGAMLAGSLINVGGSYAAAKGASEDAAKRDEENRLWQEEQFGRQQEARKSSYTPYTRGILAKSRSREPLTASPSQALTLRRAGRI